MRFAILLVFTIFHLNSLATNYYVSNDGKNNNNGITIFTPWQTLEKVQEAADKRLIKAGDSILFKRGSMFIGTLNWATIWGKNCPSGTKENPITFSAYGIGAKPVFHYPVDDMKEPANRILLRFSGVDYIVIDGLHFTDLSDTSNNKRVPANCGVPIYLGAMSEATSNHCTIKNVDISLCGMGVVIIGDSNKVMFSSLTNFKNLKSTYGESGSASYDDYGANAITITGNDNYISNNWISGAWAESADFGWNGGAFEMYNSCNRNKLINNSITDCAGVAEFGAQKKAAMAKDNLIAYNKILNCGSLLYCNIAGPFAIQVSNIQFFNNKVTEDSESRFSGSRTGAGITTEGPLALIKPSKELFAYNGDPTANIVFNLMDNTFNLSTGIAVARKSNEMNKYMHENNYYILKSGSVTNFRLSETEYDGTKRK